MPGTCQGRWQAERRRVRSELADIAAVADLHHKGFAASASTGVDTGGGGSASLLLPPAARLSACGRWLKRRFRVVAVLKNLRPICGNGATVTRRRGVSRQYPLLLRAAASASSSSQLYRLQQVRRAAGHRKRPVQHANVTQRSPAQGCGVFAFPECRPFLWQWFCSARRSAR